MAPKGGKAKNVSPQVRPGDFPLGSAASRAAARALLEERDRKVCQLWLSVVGAEEVAPPRIKRCGGGMAFIYGAGFEDHDPECTEIYRDAKSRET